MNKRQARCGGMLGHLIKRRTLHDYVRPLPANVSRQEPQQYKQRSQSNIKMGSMLSQRASE